MAAALKRPPSEQLEEPAATKPKAAEATGTWKEFEDGDPLYALKGQAAENHVIGPDGELRMDYLTIYLQKGLLGGAAKKPKDWVEIWAAMLIPVEEQTKVLGPLIAFGLEKKPQGLGVIIAELLKGHRVKTIAIREAVHFAMKDKADPYGILREFLYIVIPKSPDSEWGWSRVGWSWQEWWKVVSGCYDALEPNAAFDELGLLLDRIERGGSKTLAKQTVVWSTTRLATCRELLCKFANLDEEDDLKNCMESTLK